MSTGKRKSRSRGKNTRNSVKKTWENFLQAKESRDLLKQAWKSPNPQKDFRGRIRTLHRKFSSKKKASR